jgi:benzoyl-CoA reductase/2-hydroxyglutaryl-CoA dehydratase subunit BcrC/BadD/HgdB
MGFLVFYPENHGAMLGATRMATDLIPYANALGYSPDICSYLTCDVGSYLQKKTPLTKAYNIESVPKPDVLVFNTNQCRDVQDWFAWYSRELNVPLIGVHTHRDIGDIGEYQIKDIANQIEELVPELEAVSGEKFDMDRFKEAVGYSRRTSELWRACLESAAAIRDDGGTGELLHGLFGHRGTGKDKAGKKGPGYRQGTLPVGDKEGV